MRHNGVEEGTVMKVQARECERAKAPGCKIVMSQGSVIMHRCGF